MKAFCLAIALFLGGALMAAQTEKKTVNLSNEFRLVQITPADPAHARRIKFQKHVPDDPNGNLWQTVKTWYQGEWPEYYALNQHFK
jgi:hypothetical protein